MNHSVFDPETNRFGLLLHGVGATVIILAVLMTYMMVYAPMVERTDDTRKEIQRLQTALQDAPNIRREHQQLKTRLADISERIKQLHLNVPEDAMVSQFVSQVTEAATDEGVTISDIDTGKPVSREAYSEREIEFTGTARYASFCHLVDRIRQLPRLSKVTGLHIQTEAYGQEVHPVSLRTTIYFDIRVAPSGQDKERHDG
ncbi:MAG: type 4a pilus biogenesis protein PilO [Pirellulales bacterium]|nr:type 4a pilus biogenesis protein PilO [Pirellulales bacterium]